MNIGEKMDRTKREEFKLFRIVQTTPKDLPVNNIRKLKAWQEWHSDSGATPAF